MEKNSAGSQMFKNACLFRVEAKNFEWASAAHIYLDAPFKSTGLSAYYSALKSAEQKKMPLANWYATSGIDLKRLTAFGEWAGCTARFSDFVSKVDCKGNPKYQSLRQAPGERATSTAVSEDYGLNSSALSILDSKNVGFSRLSWVTMCGLDQRYLKARFRWNEANGFAYEDSQLVHVLKTLRWIPCKDGSWVIPRQATRKDLLEGFTVDAGYKWLEAVEFEFEERMKSTESRGRATKRAELGFESEEGYQRALD